MKAEEYFKKIETLLESGLPKNNHIELDASSANEKEIGYHAGQIYATMHQEYIIKLTHELPGKFILRVTTFEKCDVPPEDMFDVYLCGSGFEFETKSIPALPAAGDSARKPHLISTLNKIMDETHHSNKIKYIKSYLSSEQKRHEKSIGHLLKADDDYILVGLGALYNQFFIDAVIIPAHEINQLDRFLQELSLDKNQIIH